MVDDVLKEESPKGSGETPYEDLLVVGKKIFIRETTGHAYEGKFGGYLGDPLGVRRIILYEADFIGQVDFREGHAHDRVSRGTVLITDHTAEVIEPPLP